METPAPHWLRHPALLFHLGGAKYPLPFPVQPSNLIYQNSHSLCLLFKNIYMQYTSNWEATQ